MTADLAQAEQVFSAVRVSIQRWPARFRPANLLVRNGFPLLSSRSTLAIRGRYSPAIEGEERPGSAFRNSLGTLLSLAIPRIQSRSHVRRRVRPRWVAAGATLVSAVAPPRLGERTSILRHLLVGELTQNGTRQDLFNEKGVLQGHRLAGLRTSDFTVERTPIFSESSWLSGATIASMNAIPLIASRWRLAQSKPRAEPTHRRRG
jgi:hypothetical protein